MARKRRTLRPVNESSETEPQLQGGDQGRGWQPQCGGRGRPPDYQQGQGPGGQQYGRGQGSHYDIVHRRAPKKNYGGPSNYQQGQGHGGQQYGRRGVVHRGTFIDDREDHSASVQSHTLAPELHQPTLSPYQAGMTSPGSYVRPNWTLSRASSSSQAPESSQSSQISKLLEHSENLSKRPEASLSQDRLPPMTPMQRPITGSLGEMCWLKANYFSVHSDKDLRLYQYDVSISPKATSGLINHALMKRIVSQYRQSCLDKWLPAYDGSRTLYTAEKLLLTNVEFKITLDVDGPRGARQEREFNVTIKLVDQAHHLGNFLRGEQSHAPLEAIRALNIMLREIRASNSEYFYINQTFYPRDTENILQDSGLVFLRGFQQSIRPTQQNASINIDVSSTAFIDVLSVIEFVRRRLQKRDLSRPLSNTHRLKIIEELRGIKVEITHRGSLRMKYRINDLTQLATHELKFPYEGAMKSVEEYFRETYGYIIQYAHLPCLKVGSIGRPTYLPMEVCKIVEGQRYSKRLQEEKQKDNMLDIIGRRPCDRERNILQTARLHFNKPEDKYDTEFGIKMNDNLTWVKARVLPPPKLQYHKSGQDSDCCPNGGQWNIDYKMLLEGGIVKKWICINFASKSDAIERRIKTFCMRLALTCRRVGMEFKLDPVAELLSGSPKHVDSALIEAIACLEPNEKLDLLIVILPENKIDKGSVYGAVKRICDTTLGIVSQCCRMETISGFNKLILTNLALKINVKVGGKNHCLANNIPCVLKKPTIIFGADVTHPGKHPGPSIAAVVASMDWPQFTKYAAVVRSQKPGEIIRDLGGMFEELLFSFYNAAGCLPEKIVFYRDGVSDRQFVDVLRYEVGAIHEVIKSIDGYNAKVTFAVVQKRHRIRFFAENYEDKSLVDEKGNILPGTVVDTEICHPTDYDFYLCSHAANHGTSRPAHYHVLWDENHFEADHFQSLTNDLCYSFAKCTSSISIVAPVYYAHLAAFHARCFVEPEAVGHRGARLFQPTENIRRVMYYC